MKGMEMRSATKCRNKVEAGIPPPRNCPSTRDLVSSFPPLSLPGSVVLEARPDSFSLESSSSDEVFRRARFKNIPKLLFLGESNERLFEITTI